MLDLARERAHLAKADSDIADGERRIVEQAHRLECLRRAGHALDQAEGLLGNLKQTLTIWKAHRDLILQAIWRLELTSEAGRTGRVTDAPAVTAGRVGRARRRHRPLS